MGNYDLVDCELVSCALVNCELEIGNWKLGFQHIYCGCGQVIETPVVVNKIRRKEGKGTCHLQSEIIFPPSRKCIKHFKEIQFTIQGLDIALSVVSEWNSVWRTNSIACPDSLKCLVSESNFELQWNLWWKDLQTKGGIQRRGEKQDILYWLNVGTLKFGFFEEQFQQVGLFWSEDTTLTKTKFHSCCFIFKNIQFSNIR